MKVKLTKRSARFATYIHAFIFGLLALALTLPAASASAHRPVWGDTTSSVELNSIITSYAFYQNLAAGKVDVYYFEGQRGQKFHAGIEIPDMAAYQNYAVTLALFGPGFPTAQHDQLPPEHPEDLGALVIPSVVGERFFESFAQTYFLGRQSLDIELPAEGTYYLLIWNENGEAGKYVLDTGYAEDFTLIDLLAFPVWWLRVHWYYEHYLLLLAIAASFFAIVAAIMRRKKSILKTQG